MNKDQVVGKAEQITGRIKQGVGEALGNEKLANEGVLDQAKGAAKETWGKVKETAAATTEHHRQEAENNATEARSSLKGHIDHAAESINDTLDQHTVAEREKARDI